MREPKIEKIVPLEMGNFMEAPWKGSGRKVVVRGWVRDEEAQTSSEISLGKKRMTWVDGELTFCVLQDNTEFE